MRMFAFDFAPQRLGSCNGADLADLQLPRLFDVLGFR